MVWGHRTTDRTTIIIPHLETRPQNYGASMTTVYFNQTNYYAANYWDRHNFVANWWQIYAEDTYWVPPDYATLRQALEPSRNPHIARLQPQLVYMEATPGQPRRSGEPLRLGQASLFEVPVAAAVLLHDPRRDDGTVYLALFRCINDTLSLERFTTALKTRLRQEGWQRLIGPTGLSPHLGSGLLQDYWNVLPPLHTPYNPPYLPELVGRVWRPLTSSQLFQIPLTETERPASEPARLTPFDPARLATDLLPLFAAAQPASRLKLPPPDALEAAFLMRWLGRWPLAGWLAHLADQPVGFMLLQPDLAARVQRANGGRNWLWRLWLRWVSRQPVTQGRLLYLAVLPEWQRRGVGRQLFHQAINLARHHGWQLLTVGPVPTVSGARTFLEKLGARPHQMYLWYQQNL